MTASQGANLLLTSGYDPGDNGWGAAMNVNLRTLDALVFGMTRLVPQLVPPGSPVVGDLFIVAAAYATGAFTGQTNKIAVRVTLEDASATWVFHAPRDGWRVLLVPTNTALAVSVYQFRNGAWAVAAETVALVPAGGSAGNALVKVSGTDYDAAWTAPPYEVKFAFPGTPASVGILFADILTRAVNWPANFSASRVYMTPAPAADYIVSVEKNGTAIGTWTVAASANTATFTTTSGTPKSGVAGDRITMIAPDVLDATTFTLIAGTLAGTR